MPVPDTLPGFAAISFAGVGVRTGTPKEISDKIEADTRAICSDPVPRERPAGLLAETVGSSARCLCLEKPKGDHQRIGLVVTA